MPKTKRYTSYTPELMADLERRMTGLSRPECVKLIERRLKITDRQARRVYAERFEQCGAITAVRELTIADAEVEKAVKELTSAIDLYKERAAPVAEPRPIRRLFWDIETSPNIGLFWRAGWKLNIGADSILKERAIICIGWRWEGDKDSHVLHWDDEQDDKAMLTEFLKVANEADELIAHNGDKFDMPWFRTRCLFHGLEPLPTYKTVDTLAWARRQFYFNSNKLDYIASFLGLGGKIKTEFGLWKDILLKRCPVAMEKMTTYCKYDVVLLEKVWARLAALTKPKTHVGVLAGGARWCSPYDGSTDVHLSKTKVTAAGTKQYQMRETKTGRYFSIGETAYQAYREATGR